MRTRFILITFLLVASPIVLGATSSDKTCNEKKLEFDLYKDGKNSYLCNVKNFCKGKQGNDEYWDFDGDDKNKQLIEKHDPEKYPDLSSKESKETFESSLGSWSEDMSFIEKLRKKYEDTQNNVMNCAILRTKYDIHSYIIDEYDISENTEKMLEKANEKIEKKMEEQKCLKSTEKNKKETYLERNLLDSMSYEQCVYDVYLFYYKNYVGTHLWMLDYGEKKAVSILEVEEKKDQENSKIADELDLTRRTMGTALKMYEEFDRTYPTHILLNVIKVELTENKRFLGGAIKIIMQFVRFMNNAQVIETKR